MLNSTITSGASAGSRLDSLFVAFSAWRRRRALFVSTAEELDRLTDRDLADLGIPRADIRAIAREAAFGGAE